MPDNTKPISDTVVAATKPLIAKEIPKPKVDDTPQRTQAENNKVAKTYVCPACMEPYWHLLQNELDWYNKEPKQKQQELDNKWLNEHKKVCFKRDSNA